MQFTISNNVLAGAATGAALSGLVVFVLAALGSVVQSFMELGGNGGFWGKLGKGLAIYVPVGTVVGAGLAATGLPWWSVVPVTILLFFVLNAIMKKRR